MAARLKDSIQAGGPPLGPLFDSLNFSPETFHGMVARNPQFAQFAGMAGMSLPPLPPVTKKSRKSAEPRPRGGSPTKDPSKKLKLKSPSRLTPSGVGVPPISSNISTNNNYGDLDDDGGGNLKIDEDNDMDGMPGKENLENKMEGGTSEDSIAARGGPGDIDIDNSNGVSEEEEEPSMPGPGGENFVEAASKGFSTECVCYSLLEKATMYMLSGILSWLRIGRWCLHTARRGPIIKAK